MFHPTNENMKIFLLCFVQFLALGVSLPAQEIIPDDPVNITEINLNRSEKHEVSISPTF